MATATAPARFAGYSFQGKGMSAQTVSDNLTLIEVRFTGGGIIVESDYYYPLMALPWGTMVYDAKCRVVGNMGQVSNAIIGHYPMSAYNPATQLLTYDAMGADTDSILISTDCNATEGTLLTWGNGVAIGRMLNEELLTAAADKGEPVLLALKFSADSTVTDVDLRFNFLVKLP